MFCALSGETPEEPVVNVKTGHVYEKRLIMKWLESNGNKDPVNNEEELNDRDLVPLKVNKVVKPRPTSATSIPSMLQLFQNEWDALMLETYSLREQLESVRQELSHSLYQHDAACRVIARLIKERDDARSQLTSLKARFAQGGNIQNEDMEVEQSASGITEEVKEKMTQKSQELSKDRKKRQVPETLATAEEIKDYQQITSNNIHKTTPPGITCVDLHQTNQDLILTGGMDGDANLFNRAEGKVVKTFSGHNKPLTDVLFHPVQDIVFTTSKDKTAKLWKSGKEAHTVSVHDSEVVGCSLHATGEYWVTGSADMSWAFHDISTSSCLAQIQVGSAVASLQFHPDGLILGTGTGSGEVKIWDVKTQKNVATFEGHVGQVLALSFSENGYYLATGAQNTLKLWDLRKLKSFHSVDFEGSAISAVEWDYSGSYLAVAAEDIKVFLGKTLNQIASFSKHSKAVTDVKWGRDATFLVSTSMDRSLKTWGTKEKKGRKK